MICDRCGERYDVASELTINDHVRVCPNQDPVELARLILEGGEYLDAHAEVVARAYLDVIRDL